MLNTGQVIVRHLLRDALRHWAREYCLDGFAVLNAETMCQGKPAPSPSLPSKAAAACEREPGGDLGSDTDVPPAPCPADSNSRVLDSAPLIEIISMDPVLRCLKLLAYVGDNTLLPRNGERGFPHWGVWLQARKLAALLLPLMTSVMTSICTRTLLRNCDGGATEPTNAPLLLLLPFQVNDRLATVAPEVHVPRRCSRTGVGCGHCCVGIS